MPVQPRASTATRQPTPAKPRRSTKPRPIRLSTRRGQADATLGLSLVQICRQTALANLPLATSSVYLKSAACMEKQNTQKLHMDLSTMETDLIAKVTQSRRLTAPTHRSSLITSGNQASGTNRLTSKQQQNLLPKNSQASSTDAGPIDPSLDPSSNPNNPLNIVSLNGLQGFDSLFGLASPNPSQLFNPALILNDLHRHIMYQQHHLQQAHNEQRLQNGQGGQTSSSTASQPFSTAPDSAAHFDPNFAPSTPTHFDPFNDPHGHYDPSAMANSNLNHAQHPQHHAFGPEFDSTSHNLDTFGDLAAFGDLNHDVEHFDTNQSFGGQGLYNQRYGQSVAGFNEDTGNFDDLDLNLDDFQDLQSHFDLTFAPSDHPLFSLGTGSNALTGADGSSFTQLGALGQIGHNGFAFGNFGPHAGGMLGPAGLLPFGMNQEDVFIQNPAMNAQMKPGLLPSGETAEDADLFDDPFLSPDAAIKEEDLGDDVTTAAKSGKADPDSTQSAKSVRNAHKLTAVPEHSPDGLHGGYGVGANGKPTHILPKGHHNAVLRIRDATLILDPDATQAYISTQKSYESSFVTISLGPDDLIQFGFGEVEQLFHAIFGEFTLTHFYVPPAYQLGVMNLCESCLTEPTDLRGGYGASGREDGFTDMGSTRGNSKGSNTRNSGSKSKKRLRKYLESDDEDRLDDFDELDDDVDYRSSRSGSGSDRSRAQDNGLSTLGTDSNGNIKLFRSHFARTGDILGLAPLQATLLHLLSTHTSSSTPSHTAATSSTAKPIKTSATFNTCSGSSHAIPRQQLFANLHNGTYLTQNSLFTAQPHQISTCSNSFLLPAPFASLQAFFTARCTELERFEARKTSCAKLLENKAKSWSTQPKTASKSKAATTKSGKPGKQTSSTTDLEFEASQNDPDAVDDGSIDPEMGWDDHVAHFYDCIDLNGPLGPNSQPDLDLAIERILSIAGEVDDDGLLQTVMNKLVPPSPTSPSSAHTSRNRNNVDDDVVNDKHDKDDDDDEMGKSDELAVKSKKKPRKSKKLAATSTPTDPFVAALSQLGPNFSLNFSHADRAALYQRLMPHSMPHFGFFNTTSLHHYQPTSLHLLTFQAMTTIPLYFATMPNLTQRQRPITLAVNAAPLQKLQRCIQAAKAVQNHVNDSHTSTTNISQPLHDDDNLNNSLSTTTSLSHALLASLYLSPQFSDPFNLAHTLYGELLPFYAEPDLVEDPFAAALASLQVPSSDSQMSDGSSSGQLEESTYDNTVDLLDGFQDDMMHFDLNTMYPGDSGDGDDHGTMDYHTDPAPSDETHLDTTSHHDSTASSLDAHSIISTATTATTTSHHTHTLSSSFPLSSQSDLALLPITSNLTASTTNAAGNGNSIEHLSMDQISTLFSAFDSHCREIGHILQRLREEFLAANAHLYSQRGADNDNDHNGLDENDDKVDNLHTQSQPHLNLNLNIPLTTVLSAYSPTLSLLLIPKSRAATVFVSLMGLHRAKVVNLNQPDGAYSNITISFGPLWDRFAEMVLGLDVMAKAQGWNMGIPTPATPMSDDDNSSTHTDTPSQQSPASHQSRQQRNSNGSASSTSSLFSIAAQSVTLSSTSDSDADRSLFSDSPHHNRQHQNHFKGVLEQNSDEELDLY